MSILAIAGSPSPASRSTALAGWAAARLRAAGHEVDTLEVRALPATDLLLARTDSVALGQALDAVEAARGVIVATPVYKGAYAGALKAFLDLLPQRGLAGKVVLTLATGGSPAHTLAVEHALRPVLSALDAQIVIDGVFVADAHYARRAGEGGEWLLVAEAEQRLEAALDRFDEALLRYRWPLEGTRRAAA